MTDDEGALAGVGQQLPGQIGGTEGGPHHLLDWLLGR
jgi:hypothetical protein